MWKRSVDIKVFGSSNNYIDVEILKGNNPWWRLTCYYGFPERSRRREAWDLIRCLASKSNLPWCIMGDFNDMLFAGDKKGKHLHPQYLLDGFKNAVEDSMLMEVDLKGDKFTWEKSKGTSEWVREKLDRAFATVSWWQLFPLCKLSLVHTSCSDHDPINLELLSISHTKKQFRFKFENTWLKEPGFHKEVVDFWKKLSPIHFLPKLIVVSNYMAKWGRNFFHKFKDKIDKQKQEVEKYVDCTDEDNVKKYFVERDRLNELLLQEEIYRKQIAKVFWLA